MPRAVHGLESKDVVFHREGEHVFAVVLPVTRGLPQFAVIDVGRRHFLKASSPVLILDKQQKPHKQAKDAGTFKLNRHSSYCNKNRKLWIPLMHMFIKQNISGKEEPITAECKYNDF